MLNPVLLSEYYASTQGPILNRSPPSHSLVPTLSRSRAILAQDLEQLMGSIQYACKTIANLVSRSGISDLTGLQV